MDRAKKIPVIFFIFLFSGCAGLTQKGGAVLDGSAFSEKTIAIYRPVIKDREPQIEIKELRLKNGEALLEISSSAWPALALRGEMPDSRGNFHLKEARFLSTHTHGWNEFTLDLLGSAVFSASGGVIGLLRINGDIQRVQISSGMIRLKSNRLTGNAALTPLRNRRERLLALIEWMDELKETGALDQTVFTSQNDFEKYWKRRLFPELVSRKEQPASYSKDSGYRRADSVKWNLAYTEQLFPEGLWEYRNSGALLRDWEEALPWIFMEYSWNYIIDSFDAVNLLIVK